MSTSRASPPGLEAAEVCTGLGHIVVEAAPAVDQVGFESHFPAMFAAFAEWVRIDWEERLGRAVTEDDFEPLAWALADRGRKQTAGQHLKHVQELHRVSRVVGEFFVGFDLLLTPTVAVPALPLGSFAGRGGQANTRRCLYFGALANATGQPAMSIPMTPTADGLPLGAQFIAPFGDEITLYQLAGQLERAAPWAHRRPPVLAIN